MAIIEIVADFDVTSGPQAMEGASVRHSMIGKTSSFAAAISHYPSFLVQPPHMHLNSQLSFLLAGSLIENAHGRNLEVGAPRLCRKPKATVHSDRFGPHGALILSVRFTCERTAELVLDSGEWRWMRLSVTQRRALLACVAEARVSQSGEELWDILAGGEEPEAQPRPPDWLCWAKARLEAEPGAASIAELAASAGVHRVHLSREFSRNFGIGPCSFRQRQMATQALNLMVQHGAPAVIAAHETGFADQSHMVRAVKRAVGLTPGRISALLA